jgi:hypothetical protein
MAIQGLRTTGNFAANERPENWREGLLRLYPNSAEAAKAPLTALTSKMKSRGVDDPVYHWWEKELDDRRFALAANLDTTQNNVTIDPAYKTSLSLKEGDVLMVEQTGEIMHVTQNPVATNTITVARGIGNSGTGVAITYNGANINYFLLVVGSAYEEGSMAPVGINFDPTERSNYTQIFRNTLEMTRTASKTRLRTTDQVKEAKRECLEYAGIDMERAFWFGKKHVTTKNGKPLRFTAGVRDQINSLAPGNIKTWNTAITMDLLEAEFLNLFKFGSSEKVMIGGNRALLTIGQVIRKNATWNIQNGLKEFGMSVTRITSPFGELVFLAHPLFTQSGGGADIATTGSFPGLSASAAILDMAQLEYVYLNGDDLRYEADLKSNGLDGMKSGYIAECGMQLSNAKTHFWWNNVSSAAKDS